VLVVETMALLLGIEIFEVEFYNGNTGGGNFYLGAAMFCQY